MMQNHPHICRAAVLTMCGALLLGSVPAAAVVDDGVKPTYDEAYYATTDYYGNLVESSVVKSYVTNGVASLTDYGDYDEIINLTDHLLPVTANGKSVFTFEEDNIPTHFYFEGKTTKPFETLPWSLAVHYSLNGVAMKAEDLAGKTGVVEITVDAIPNENASEYARNNYTLEAMAIFNQDDILSLEAPGAQVQLIGNLRAVLFIGFPGEECHFTIRVGSEQFSFGGMTFLMVPATLSQLEEIAKLSQRKDDLEENYEKLSGSLDDLLDSMSGISSSLYATAKGLDQLNQAQDIFSAGKGTIRGDVTALRGDLSNLVELLDPVEAQISALSETISDAKSVLRDLTSASSDLRDELRDLENALEDLENGTGDVKSVLNAAGTLQTSFNTLRRALGDTSANLPSEPVVAPNTGTEMWKLMWQVVQLHEIYTRQDEEAFFAGMLALQDYSSTQAAQLYQLYTGITQLQAAAAAAEAGGDAAAAAAYKAQADQLIKANAASWQTAQTLHALYAGKQSMSFQKFCESVLPMKYPDKTAAEIKTLAKTANDLWLVYASGDTTGASLSDETLAAYSVLADEDAVYTLTAASLQNDSIDEDSNPVTGNDTPKDNDTTEPEEDEPPEADEPEEEPNEKANDAIVDLITSGIDSASSQINALQRQLTSAMNTVVPPTNDVLRELADLCGKLNALPPVLDDAEDLSSAVRGASRELRAILGGTEDLLDLLDDYEPTLQETLATVSTLSTRAATVVRNTETLLADTQSLLNSMDAPLDTGTKQTLEGLAASLRATAKSLSITGDMKTSKRSLCDIIEDTWNEYTGEVNNLLLMDATAEAVSLTDTRNDAPQSIQVLIRTQEIKQDTGTQEELTGKTTEETTFWQRFAQMFKDFWSAVTGIFKGKD